MTIHPDNNITPGPPDHNLTNNRDESHLKMAYIYPDPSLLEKDFARATTEETASAAPPSPNHQLSTMEQDHPTPAPAAMAPPGRQRRPKEGDSYAKETVRNKARAVEIIKSGQRQDPACDNCKRMGNQCFIDLKISNLCQYCVEKKKVCSANKFGKKSFKLDKTEKQIEDELGNGMYSARLATWMKMS